MTKEELDAMLPVVIAAKASERLFQAPCVSLEWSFLHVAIVRQCIRGGVWTLLSSKGFIKLPCCTYSE